MRSKVIAVTLAGALGVTGAAVVVPAVASAQSPGAAASEVGGRLGAIKDALAGLVKDGTLTQAQADKVASRLDSELPGRGHGPGGMNHGRFGGGVVAEEVAKAVGITVEELRAGMREGKTLAQLAEAEGVSKAELVKRLVAAATARLDQAVKEGDLTKEQADARKATLQERITAMVDRAGKGPRGGGFGKGHGNGHGHGWGPGGRFGEGDDDEATPKASPR